MKDRRIGLPVHPVSAKTRMPTVLRLQGLISRQQVLRKTDFAALPHVEINADFSCEEGWTVPGLRWRGVALQTLSALAQPLPKARYLRVGAGAYEVTLALDSLDGALLCDALDGKPLSPEHGAPWRLLVPGDKCFTSVKWVDRLEVTSGPGEPLGERVARSRLRPSPFLSGVPLTPIRQLNSASSGWFQAGSPRPEGQVVQSPAPSSARPSSEMTETG